MIYEARHSFGGTDLDFFRRQLAVCAEADGTYGPRRTLPLVLGVIAIIEHDSRHANSSWRRELLLIGARSAEFAGWLYRDVGMPDAAEYWRDRAMEWAQAAADAPMQGYVLLKKSQAAWDNRDAVRMLTLAEAAQDGPWRLPARVRAEAAQQQARAHAMLGRLDDADAHLDAARQLLAAQDDDARPDLSAHYDAAVLGLQTAICDCESGRPERAVRTYERQLSTQEFSRRDRSYFTALKAIALARTREPDDAATAGMNSLRTAAETLSTRTLRELKQLDGHLRRWPNRPRVREFHEQIRGY